MFAQLPFANGFHEDHTASSVEKHLNNMCSQLPSPDMNGLCNSVSRGEDMDCVENKVPGHVTQSDQHTGTSLSGFKVIPDTEDKAASLHTDNGHFVDDFKQSRPEPFSCLKFKDLPVKCQSYFMSHYI